jgi:hypothetical protein
MKLNHRQEYVEGKEAKILCSAINENMKDGNWSEIGQNSS